MRLLLSNNKQVENSVNKDGMETWSNQQSAVQTGGEATPADKWNSEFFRYVLLVVGLWPRTMVLEE
jgi:hypothetical protein